MERKWWNAKFLIQKQNNPNIGWPKGDIYFHLCELFLQWPQQLNSIELKNLMIMFSSITKEAEFAVK